MSLLEQEQVSGGTTNTVLRNLLSDTPYTVAVVPVYPEGDGLRQSDRGKTRKSHTGFYSKHQLWFGAKWTLRSPQSPLLYNRNDQLSNKQQDVLVLVQRM